MLSTDERQAIAQKYAAGATSLALATEFSVSTATILKIVREQGGTVRSRGVRAATERPDAVQSRRTVLSADERQAIAQKYAAGASSVALASEFSVSAATILKIIRNEGGTVRARGAYAAAERPDIIQRYQQGESSLTLAQEYNLSPGGVLGLVRRAGVPVRSGRPRSLSEEQVEQIVTSYREGVSSNALAQEFQVTGPTILRVVREAGEPVRPPGSGGRPTTEVSDDQRTMAEQYAQGKTAAMIAAEFGVSRPTVLAAVRKCGGQVRPVGPVSNVSDEARAEIVRRYEAGEGSTGLGAEFGLSAPKVLSIIREAGREVRPAGGRPVDGEVQAEILRRYAAGESSTSIGEDVGLRYETVLAVVRRAGQPVRSPGPNRLSNEQRLSMAEHYASGGTLQQIADEVGVSVPTARKALLGSGVVLRGRGRPRRNSSEQV